MAGFVPGLLAAIPTISKVIKDIKDGIQDKTKQAEGAASDAATKAVKDQKKGPVAAKAATAVVSEETRKAVDAAAAKLKKEYSAAQLKLSVQLEIAADLDAFFAAEDNLYAMKEVIIYKDNGKRLNEDDVRLLTEWWDTAGDNLKTIKQKEVEIRKLDESAQKQELLNVIHAIDHGAAKRIDHAFKTGPLSALDANARELHMLLETATGAALEILRQLSAGLKEVATTER